MKLCFATRNENKLREIKNLLGNHFEILSLDDIGCQDELPETQDTIEGNSLQKAQYVWDHFQVNCFADDSGLEVEALGGAPGVDSAFYSGTRDFDANIALLLQNLENQENRQARFKTVISLIINNQSNQFTGIVEGEILPEKRGQEGFGYDPIFLPHGYSRTFAEMSLSEKNKISHRAQAFQLLAAFLENNS